jgi:hypothetical protein
VRTTDTSDAPRFPMRRAVRLSGSMLSKWRIKSATALSRVTFGLPESQFAEAPGPKEHLRERAAKRASNVGSAALAVGAPASRQQNKVITIDAERLSIA